MDKKLTAAEFKRRFTNKQSLRRATDAVAVRSTIGAMTGPLKATAKDKARLRNSTMRSEALPGEYHKPENLTVGAISKHANRRHLVTTF